MDSLSILSGFDLYCVYKKIVKRDKIHYDDLYVLKVINIWLSTKNTFDKKTKSIHEFTSISKRKDKYEYMIFNSMKEGDKTNFKYSLVF